jgi:hypothetical protein
MKVSCKSPNTRVPVMFATLAAIALSFYSAGGQGVRTTTPDLNRRLENEKMIRDNERFRRGMEADIEARGRTTKERQELANKAFVRLKALHNEIMEITLTVTAPEPKAVLEKLAETKKARSNFALTWLYLKFTRQTKTALIKQLRRK